MYTTIPPPKAHFHAYGDEWVEHINGDSDGDGDGGDDVAMKPQYPYLYSISFSLEGYG